MINKGDIIDFFDEHACKWDIAADDNPEIIELILGNAGIKKGLDVLDVACGTGILFPYYLKRGVNSVTAIDISPQMIAIAKRKFTDTRVEIICGDIENIDLKKQFDAIVVYNAFPHFPNPSNLIKALYGMIKTGGILTIAHGKSRIAIDEHHKGSAHCVSNGLMHESELVKLFEPYWNVNVCISNDFMYQVAGKAKK